MEIASFLFFIAILSFMLWLEYEQKERHLAAMMRVAAAMGLDFSETDNFSLGRQLRIFGLFDQWWFPWRYVHNIIPGVLDDADVFLFEFSYWVRKRTIRQTVFVAIANNHQKFPEFRFRHDRWYEVKLTNRHRAPVPNGEIRFNREILWAHETEEFVRENLAPELRALLTEQHPAQIESLDGYLLIYKPEVLLGADAARIFYEDCCALTELIQSNSHRHRLLQWAEKKGKDY